MTTKNDPPSVDPIGGSPGSNDRVRTDAERTKRQDDLLDEALEETFPASDPVSVFQIT